MVYAGITTINYFRSGKTPVIHIEVAGLDANGEQSASFDAFNTGFDWIPNAAMIIISQTAGTTAACDVSIEGSNNNIDFVADLAAVTDCEVPVTDWYPNQDFSGAIDTHETYRYWRVDVDTVGAGNTLTANLYLYHV